MTRERVDDLARKVIDSNRYMALGTADADGHPCLHWQRERDEMAVFAGQS
jgi:hypothetical protein